MPTSKLLLIASLSLNLLGLVACNIPSPQLRDSTRDSEGNTVATFFITDVKGDALPATLKKNFATQSKIFNFTVCLKDQAQSKPLVGHPFRVEEIHKELKSDEKGCLNWSEEVSFNFLSEPTYLDWKRQITATGLHKGTRVARFAINPWSDNDASHAVVNLETMTPPQLVTGCVDTQELLVTDCKAKNTLPATVSLKSVNYTTLSYNYEIDSLLNLTFKKKFRFKVDAAVSIFSNMPKGRMESTQKLRPGVYLLKFALIKNRDYYNQKTYVSSAEKLVTTLDGDIRTDIEFKTADLKALKERNTLLVEIDPVKEDKITVDKDGNIIAKEKTDSLDELIDRSTGLYNRTFSTAMILNSDSDFQELTALETKDANLYLTYGNLPKLDETHKSVIREYIKYGEKIASENLQVQKAQSDMGLFAKNNSLQQISVAEAKDSEDFRTILAAGPARMNEAQVKMELDQLATKGKISTALSKDLCAYWFKNFIAKDLWSFFSYHALAECGIHANLPEQLFTVEKRLFVKELDGYSFLKGYNSAITVGNNLTLTKSQTQANSITKSLNFNMGLSQTFAKIFSIGVSGSYAISQTDSWVEATANSVSVNSNVSLLMQKNIYQLKLKRYQECSIVKINPKQFMKNGFFESALSPKLKDEEKAEVVARGLMVCTGVDNTTPIVRNENYYLLTQETASSQMQDNGDGRNLNFFIALRGEKEYRRLMYFMKGSVKTPQTADRSSDENSSTNLEGLFSSGSANIPGSYNDTP